MSFRSIGWQVRWSPSTSSSTASGGLPSLPSLSIDAFPHGMMSAHEMGAMAAIFGANVEGLSTRGQSCGNARNRTRAVAGLGSNSMAVDCCGGAPSAGCGVDPRTTGTVQTDFGNTAESSEIELVGVA